MILQSFATINLQGCKVITHLLNFRAGRPPPITKSIIFGHLCFILRNWKGVVLPLSAHSYTYDNKCIMSISTHLYAPICTQDGKSVVDKICYVQLLFRMQRKSSTSWILMLWFLIMVMCLLFVQCYIATVMYISCVVSYNTDNTYYPVAKSYMNFQFATGQ